VWTTHEKGIIKRVRTQNSKKGRPRKVIDQGKAKISFTDKAVTSHGGMALVSRALDHFHVREDMHQAILMFLPRFWEVSSCLCIAYTLFGYCVRNSCRQEINPFGIL
jgi:hypothetical protein